MPYLTRIRDVLLCLLLLGAWPLAHADIVIGQSTPLSGSAGEAGRGLSLGMAMAIAQVNDQGGVNGEKLRLVILDDKSTPAQALTNTQTLIKDEQALVLAGYHGTATLQELSKQGILNDAKVALVGVAGATEISDARNRYVFFTRTGLAQEVQTLVALLADKLGAKRIGILTSNDASLVSARDAAMAELARRGLKAEGIGTYDKASDSIDPAMKPLLEAAPDAVLMLVPSKPAALFAKRFRESGGTAQLYSTSSVNFEEVVKLIGAETARGIGIAQVYPYPFDTRLKVVREYQEALKKHARNEKLSYASMEGYIVGRTVVEALKRAGKGANREAVQRALEGMNSVDMGGFFISFSERQHNGAQMVDVTMIGSTGSLTR